MEPLVQLTSRDEEHVAWRDLTFAQAKRLEFRRLSKKQDEGTSSEGNRLGGRVGREGSMTARLGVSALGGVEGLAIRHGFLTNRVRMSRLSNQTGE